MLLAIQQLKQWILRKNQPSWTSKPCIHFWILGGRLLTHALILAQRGAVLLNCIELTLISRCGITGNPICSVWFGLERTFIIMAGAFILVAETRTLLFVVLALFLSFSRHFGNVITGLCSSVIWNPWLLCIRTIISGRCRRFSRSSGGRKLFRHLIFERTVRHNLLAIEGDRKWSTHLRVAQTISITIC